MDKYQQEILFIYLINLNNENKLFNLNNFKCNDEPSKIFSWHKFDEVKNLKCLPEMYLWSSNKK